MRVGSCEGARVGEAEAPDTSARGVTSSLGSSSSSVCSSSEADALSATREARLDFAEPDLRRPAGIWIVVLPAARGGLKVGGWRFAFVLEVVGAILGIVSSGKAGVLVRLRVWRLSARINLGYSTSRD